MPSPAIAIFAAAYMAASGVLLPAPGSRCDIGQHTPVKIVEYPLSDVLAICRNSGGGRECGFPGRYDGVALVVVPQVGFFNGVDAETQRDLIKHGVTHYIPGCREWHRSPNNFNPIDR